MSSRPSWHYHSGNARWELRGKSGVLLNTVPDTNIAMGKVTAAIGSSNAITSVGTWNDAQGTMAVTGVRAGDAVFASPRVALSGKQNPTSFYVPTHNFVYFYVVNPAEVEGSFPAMSWDVYAIRRA